MDINLGPGVITTEIYADTPEYFAEKFIEYRDRYDRTVIAKYKGTYYAACDGVTVEDIVDAIKQEIGGK